MIEQRSDRFRGGFALFTRRADPTFVPKSKHNVVNRCKEHAMRAPSICLPERRACSGEGDRCMAEDPNLERRVAGFSADFARLPYRNQPPPGHAQGFHESGR
jgi:hypothetical protein